MSRLGLKEGDTMAWNEACKLVRLNVNPGKLAGLCGDCRWRGLKFCAEGLAQLAAAGSPKG